MRRRRGRAAVSSISCISWFPRPSLRYREGSGRMTMTDAAAFAAEIALRHEKRERVTLEMPDGRAGDLAFGYETQAALWPLMGPGAAIVGWKVGLTTPRMQQMC